MQCPRCRSDNPDVARFCFKCGEGLRAADASRHGRADSFAVQSAESVTQFALISTVMPHTNRKTADGYRWALLITGGLALVLAMIGLIPAAIVAAAAAVPVAYLVYFYDVNLWEDAPLPTVLTLFLLTGLLATGISLLFFRGAFEDELLQMGISASQIGIDSLSFGPLLIFAVVLPVVAEIAKNIGAVWFVTRPGHDDMIDGLTFGVASGVAYAAFETMVAFGPVFTASELQTTDNLLTWVVVILSLMVVKPLIYGTATGLAVAAFSGRGEGFDGFTPKYFANFAFAAGMNVLYWLGVHLFAYADAGHALGLLWGVVIAAVLVIRVRVMLHTALLEVAAEDAAQGKRSVAAVTEGGVCPECEMDLVADALFCIACGESVRATSAAGRRHIREAASSGAPA